MQPRRLFLENPTKGQGLTCGAWGCFSSGCCAATFPSRGSPTPTSTAGSCAASTKPRPSCRLSRATCFDRCSRQTRTGASACPTSPVILSLPRCTRRRSPSAKCGSRGRLMTPSWRRWRSSDLTRRMRSSVSKPGPTT
eukprot:Rmarinus@m.25456